MAQWAERLLDTAPFHQQPAGAPSLGPADWALQGTEETWGRWYIWDEAVARVMQQCTAAPRSEEADG